MINKLSIKLMELFFTEQIFTEEERDLYVYGFFMLLSHLMYLVLASLFGILLGAFPASVIFYILFQYIRRNAGGYHASTELKCEILSTLLIFSSIVLIKFLIVYEIGIIVLGVTFASTMTIFFFCPIDTPEKPLTKEEFLFFRKKTRISLAVILFIIIVCYILKQKILFVPCCIGIIAESILIVAGKIKRINKNIEKDK